MADACIPVGSGPGFLGGTLAFVDCQAEGIGQGGYQALTMPGSIGAVATGAALTLFVALVGYRLLLGERVDMRDGIVAVAKIGLVLMLAASWPAFRTLVYDTTMHGPAELAATIGAPAALPGAGGGLVVELQALDDGFVELVKLGSGKPPDADIVAGPTVPLDAQQQQQERRRLDQAAQRPRWDAQHDARLIGQARTIFLAATIGAFASLRLLAGVLIALGPIFLTFLLFDTTRGIFEGWVRGLGGVIVAAAATAVVLGVELALVGPWLGGVLEARRDGVAVPGAPIEAVALASVFAVALAAVLIGTGKVAHGFRLSSAVRRAVGRATSTAWLGESEQRAMRQSGATIATRAERGRSTEVAEAIIATQRREAIGRLPPATRLAQALAGLATAEGPPQTVRDFSNEGLGPDGRRERRRARARLSAGAMRRDRTA